MHEQVPRDGQWSEFGHENKHEMKTCPRCLFVFECRADDITKCQCYAVKLTGKQREQLARRYTGCLCVACMLAVRDQLIG